MNRLVPSSCIISTHFQYDRKSFHLRNYVERAIGSNEKSSKNLRGSLKDSPSATQDLMDTIKITELMLSDGFECDCDKHNLNICDLIPYNVFHAANLSTSSTYADKSILTVHVNGYFGALLMETLTRSDIFYSRFYRFISHLITSDVVCYDQKKTTKLKTQNLVVVIVLRWPTEIIIDFKWYMRVAELISKRVTLEECMAWLSTLGGGYSSMGDHSECHAETAGRISLRQFHIAIEMADPIMQCKCVLFMALSLMQRGQVSRAKRMIKKLYGFIQRQTWCDECLTLMCRGVWSKLQFFHKQKKIRCSGNL
ncbi:uncharacterized protein LOC141898314 [Tubulanus polymorphus]|uniref:uncharacterized protein LOC141898314 n=1 Tax=Tubulanus polymorphus TaxID=672921 RepID=UPI003DA33FC7